MNRTQHDAPPKVGEPQPCRYCNAMTPHETLRTLGARCLPCYRHYCESANRNAA